jgi:large subunit ribosomal protein L23
MKNVYSVIKRPLFTEKGARLKEAENKLMVEVDPKANKAEIKRAVEEIFKVKVEGIHTVKLPGKWKTYGRSQGKRPAKKKAIITLKKGEKLDFIEGT